MITILNIIRIIYSHIIVDKYKDVKLDGDLIERIIESHLTSNLNDYEACVWIKYLKGIDKYSNWNEYQMYREWLYHKNCYNHNWFVNHTNYVDFEKVQTAKTYIYRIVGNCIY